jgi:hypothetical protein
VRATRRRSDEARSRGGRSSRERERCTRQEGHRSMSLLPCASGTPTTTVDCARTAAFDRLVDCVTRNKNGPWGVMVRRGSRNSDVNFSRVQVNHEPIVEQTSLLVPQGGSTNSMPKHQHCVGGVLPPLQDISIERVFALLQEPARRRSGAVATQSANLECCAPAERSVNHRDRQGWSARGVPVWSADSMNVTFGVRYFGECFLGWTAATGDFGSGRGAGGASAT